MDQEKIVRQIEGLEIQLLIASILIEKKQAAFSIEDIVEIQKISNIDEREIVSALRIMLSHGLITHKFAQGRIVYLITEFGVYFFEQLCKGNSETINLFVR